MVKYDKMDGKIAKNISTENTVEEVQLFSIISPWCLSVKLKKSATLWKISEGIISL